MAKNKTKAKVLDAKVETKADKFRRLGKARLETALNKIRLIGNLAGPGYEYTEDQLKTINDHLTTAVGDTIARFQPKSKAAKVEISL